MGLLDTTQSATNNTPTFDPHTKIYMIEGFVNILLAVIGSGAFGALTTWLLTRKKNSIELERLNAEKEAEIRENLRKEANALREAILELEKKAFELEKELILQANELALLEANYQNNLIELMKIKSDNHAR